METVTSLLQNTSFQYRDMLHIPRYVNFGLELELEQVNPQDVYKLVRSKMGGNWFVKEDKSLAKGKSAEIVSPVLNNSKDTWLLLGKLGELLEKLNPSYENCSFQVNFDGSLLPTVDDRVRFLKLYAMYEDIIYRFSKGEDAQYRSSLDMYASPIILALKGILQVGDLEALDIFSNQKRYGIAFKTDGRDLLEFRTPNMSSNPIYWQNYINTFYHLVMFSKNGRYDRREIDKYIDEFSKTYILESYDFDKTDKAIDLSKKIFVKNDDRCNFLHQYMKR